MSGFSKNTTWGASVITVLAPLQIICKTTCETMICLTLKVTGAGPSGRYRKKASPTTSHATNSPSTLMTASSYPTTATSPKTPINVSHGRKSSGKPIKHTSRWSSRTASQPHHYNTSSSTKSITKAPSS